MGYSIEVEKLPKRQIVRIYSDGLEIFMSNCSKPVEIDCLKDIINVGNFFGYTEDRVGSIITALTQDTTVGKKD